MAGEQVCFHPLVFRILKKVRHPHITMFYGISVDDESQQIRLVTELLDCSLLDFLRDGKHEVDNALLLKISQDVCSGMDHLSSMDIVHRDLAARNVLVKVVGSGVECKLCDFGLGRETDNNYYTVSAPGVALPIKWTAPEALEKKRFSVYSDVWSFGVVLWEVFSIGVEPFLDWKMGEILPRIKKGERLDRPLGCPKEIYDLMLQCWALTPKQRPLFETLFHALGSVSLTLSTKVEESSNASLSSSDVTDSGTYVMEEKNGQYTYE